MKRTLIDKIHDVLISFSEINHEITAATGTRYYRISHDTYIRLGDHIRTQGNKATYLNIIVKDNVFCVFFGNKLIDIPSNVFLFKKWLKTFIPLANTLKQNYANLVDDPKTGIPDEVADIHNQSILFDINGLTKKQINHILKDIQDFKSQNLNNKQN